MSSSYPRPSDVLLHILTSDDILARADFLPVAHTLIQIVGPRGAFHLRTRTLTGRAYVALTDQLATACRAHGTTLIINERVDVALAGHAHGVQLGRGALTPHEVRRIAPHLAIGVSIHSVDEVIALTDVPSGNDTPSPPTPTDWLIFGQLFESATHPSHPGQGLQALRHATTATTTPIIAVGGITPAHIPAILDAGAAGVAVISGIWDAEEPSAAATRYLSAYGDAIVRGRDPSHS